MKTVIAPLLVFGMIGIGAALGQDPIARADVPYVDTGSYDELTNIPDENANQDMELFDNTDSTWPEPVEEFLNSDVSAAE